MKCKGCDKRNAECHITCEDYAEFKRKLEEQKNARSADRLYKEAKVDSVERYFKRARRSGWMK